MAVFSEPESFGTLDYMLLQNASVNLYCDPGLLTEDLQWLRQRGYHIDRFDCSSWTEESTVLDHFRQTLNFRDSCGSNFNALNDCLSDLEIPDESGRVLVLEHYDKFATHVPDLAWSLLDMLERTSRGLLLFGRRLITIAHSLDPILAFPPLGSVNSAHLWTREFVIPVRAAAQKRRIQMDGIQ